MTKGLRKHQKSLNIFVWILNYFLEEPDVLMILKLVDHIWSKMEVGPPKQRIFNGMLHGS